MAFIKNCVAVDYLSLVPNSFKDNDWSQNFGENKGTLETLMKSKLEDLQKNKKRGNDVEVIPQLHFWVVEEGKRYDFKFVGMLDNCKVEGPYYITKILRDKWESKTGKFTDVLEETSTYLKSKYKEV